MKTKDVIIYALAMILIFVIALNVMNGDENSGNSSGNVVANDVPENAQKVVIGMKNYNYYPNTITVKAGIPVSISLDDSVSGCYRGFTIRELGLAKYLKTPQDTLVFTPTQKGTYRFACSMGMGTGTLIVE